MEASVLAVETRSETGSKPARRLRARGKIPAVVYGHHDPISLTVDAHEFYRLYHAITESTIITLKVGDKDIDVLIKDYDEDIRTGKIRHIDFFEIERGKKLHTRVELTLQGSPVGVREGGILEHLIYDLDIECLPKDIPQRIVVDVTNLELGTTLHVSDIETPEGVTVLNSPEQAVVVVATPKVVVEETEEEEEVLEGEAAEEGAAPEVENEA